MPSLLEVYASKVLIQNSRLTSDEELMEVKYCKMELVQSRILRMALDPLATPPRLLSIQTFQGQVVS